MAWHMISNQLKDYDGIFKLPFIVSYTIIPVIVTITALSQFPDAIEKYFPPLYNHICLNMLPISLTLNVALSLLALLGLHFTKNYFIMIGKNSVEKFVDVITPSSEGSFYMEYFHHLAQKAAIHAGPIRIILTYHAPGTPFVNLEVGLSGIRQRIANTRTRPDGFFIIPADTTDQTKQFIVENQSKIIVLDVWPFSSSSSSNPSEISNPNEIIFDPNKINFVRGDEKEGGKQAASIATDYFKTLKKDEQEVFKTKKIGILKGSEINYENGRIESFKEHIKKFFEGVGHKIELEEIGNFNYQRKDVKQHIFRNFKEMFGYSVIFASNDDMALGIRDGYTKLISNNQIDEKGLQKLPKIIGYDRTMLMHQCIQLKDNFILGSVDVKIEQQAEMAVAKMYKLMCQGDKKESEKIDVTITPERWVNYYFFDAKNN